MSEEVKSNEEQESGEVSPPAISIAIAGKHILCSEVSSVDNRLYSGSSVPRGEIIIWDIMKPRRILHRLPPIGWSPPESYETEKMFEPYSNQERFHTMPVMGIKLIGDILISVSLDGTLILWDNLKPSPENPLPKAIHVIFNENESSSENLKISLTKTSNVKPRLGLGIEMKSFLYALLAGYLAAIIIGLACWYAGRLTEIGSALAGVGSGVVVGVVTGIATYVIKLLKSKAANSSLQENGSDEKATSTAKDNYKDMEMAEQGQQSQPDMFESAEDGLISPDDVLDESVAGMDPVNSVASGSIHDADKAGSTLSKAASTVTAPALKKAASTATAEVIAGNLLLAASGNFEHELELESTIYLPRPGSTLGKLLRVENPVEKPSKKVFADDELEEQQQGDTAEEEALGGVGFTCLAVMPVEDPPEVMVQQARVEVSKALNKAVGKSPGAAEGYLVFAGDEMGVVTIWLVLPKYFYLITNDKALRTPMTPRPIKVCSLRIGQSQMVTALLVEGGRLYVGGQFGSVVSWDILEVLSGNYDECVHLTTDRCRTRVTSLAVSSNRLFVGCLGNFNYPPGYKVEYLGYDVRWAPAVIVNVKPDSDDIMLTKYDIITHPDYDGSQDPNQFAEFFVADVSASQLRNFKNEDGLAHLKKGLSLFASTIVGMLDGSVNLATCSLARFVELKTSDEFDQFKTNVDAFIDATGANVDFGAGRRYAYGALALTRKSLGGPFSLPELSFEDAAPEMPATIFVWDISDWNDPPVEPAWALGQHLAGVSSLRVEGTNLYSGSYDHSVCVWDITPAETTAEWEMDSNLPPPVSWKQPSKLVRISGFSGAIHCISMLDGDIIAGTSDYSIEGTSTEPLQDKCGPGPAPGPNSFQFELQELDGFSVNAFPDPYGIWIPTKRPNPKPWFEALGDFIQSSLHLALFSLWPGRFQGLREPPAAASIEPEDASASGVVEGGSEVDPSSNALSSWLSVDFWSKKRGSEDSMEKQQEVDPEGGSVGDNSSEKQPAAGDSWLQSSLQLFMLLGRMNDASKTGGKDIDTLVADIVLSHPELLSNKKKADIETRELLERAQILLGNDAGSEPAISPEVTVETRELLDRAQVLLDRANSNGIQDSKQD